MEETAALFDGEKPEQDLVQLGGEAATLTINCRGIVSGVSGMSGMITPDRRAEKSTDYATQDIYLELRRSYVSPKDESRSQTDSRRQSQESDIAIVL